MIEYSLPRPHLTTGVELAAPLGGSMRRIVSIIALSVLSPIVAVVGGTSFSVAAPSTPAVKEVTRQYGAGPVRLAARQRADISFRARRRDRVSLEAQVAGKRRGPCSGRAILVDGRGARRAKLDRVFRVRTSGTAVFRFRGRCGTRRTPLPVRVQLQKLRLRRIGVDGRDARVRTPRRGYVDVAWTRVPASGRVKLTARNRRSRETYANRVLVGSRLGQIHAAHASIQDGQPLVQHPNYYRTDRPALKRGTLVGLVLPVRGTVDARTAVVHHLTIDGPALTLTPDRGREHVLTFTVPEGVETYLSLTDPASWKGWTQYSLPPEEFGDQSVHRIVVVSDADARVSDTRQVRVRSVLEAPDLVVGGPPVKFESADPGQWFFARTPPAYRENVRMSATDVAVTGEWRAEIKPWCGGRDCLFETGMTLDNRHLVAYFWLRDRYPVEGLFVRFEPGASGGVTLTLSAIP